MTLLALWGISDVVWQALIAAAVTIILAWMQQRAANRVSEVKTTLQQSNTRQEGKLDDIHRLVNKPLATALKAVALAYRERAERPGATEGDKVAADAAERDYREHERKQALVDAASMQRLETAKTKGENP